MAYLTKHSYTKIALIASVGLLLICGVAVLTTGGCMAARGVVLGNSANVGSASVEASDVKNLAIDWAAGQVDICVVKDSETVGNIELVETTTGTVTHAQQMRWILDGNTLRIDYGGGWSCFAFGHKSLEVRIPQSCAQQLGGLYVSGASGRYNLSNFSCENLQIDLASGQVDAAHVTADTLAVDVVSGQVNIEGSFAGSVDMNTTSGTVSVFCNSAPHSVRADVTSGHMMLALPDDAGFTAYVDKTSGSFSSDFKTTQEGDTYRCGNGETDVRVDIISGDFALNKCAANGV